MLRAMGRAALPAITAIASVHVAIDSALRR
jgi:hypothetical protein